MADAAVILASASPRRRELMRRLGIEPIVHPADLDERPRPGEHASDLVTRLAAAKAATVAAQVGAGPHDLVIGADTAVTIDGALLGKPLDRADAVSMLERLAGRTHHVVTGVAVRRGGEVADGYETTEVAFRALTDGEVAWYLDTAEPFDKAGAYALQGAGAAFVTAIRGNDTNVIGLPLPLTVALARKVGVDLLDRGRGTPGTRDA